MSTRMVFVLCAALALTVGVATASAGHSPDEQRSRLAAKVALRLSDDALQLEQRIAQESGDPEFLTVAWPGLQKRILQTEASLEFFIGVAGELVRADVAEQIALLKNLLDELKGEEARLRQLLLGKQTTEAIPVFRSVATTAHGIASAASDVARLLLCPLSEDG